MSYVFVAVAVKTLFESVIIKFSVTEPFSPFQTGSVYLSIAFNFEFIKL